MRFEQNPKNFDDWKGLHRLLVESFAYMDGLIQPPSSILQTTPDDLQRKAQAEHLMLVWDDDHVIACAFFDVRDDVIYIGKIAVAASHQGHGIATQIIDKAVVLAIQQDKQWLELETRIELIGNQQAFGKMGFITTAQNSHSGFDHVTSLTMRRII